MNHLMLGHAFTIPYARGANMANVTRFITLTWTCDHCGTRNRLDYRHAFRFDINAHCTGDNCPVRIGWNRHSDTWKCMHVPSLDRHEQDVRRLAQRLATSERWEKRAENRLKQYLVKRYGYAF